MNDVYSPITNPVPAATPDVPENFMADAPDLTFDQMFADTTSQTPSVPQVPEPQTPAPSQSQFEIKTSTGTVYKTVEDAVKGIEHKDATIDRLRTELALRDGVDPITKQPIHSPAQQGSSYLQDQKKYMKDLASAVEKGDEDAYFQTQAKFVSDLLAPIAPIITDFAKSRAVERVSSEISEFSTFRSSDDFKVVLKDNPALAGAIQAAESDFRGHEQLPELYRLAYLAAQGRKLPEILRQQREAAAKQTQAPPVRQTLAPSTQAPAAEAALPLRPDGRVDLSSREARQAIIKQFEANVAQMNKRL